MTIDLYYATASPPCWSVILTARALKLDLNLKQVNTMAGEHKTPEYLKINPQHTIPTIVDDGFALAESRAIITYLVNKYGKGSTLYPEEPKARAIVDQRLYFDIGTLYQRFADYLFPVFFAGSPFDQSKLEKLEDALQTLNTFLEGQKYVAGPNLTVADLSAVSVVTAIKAGGIDIEKYDNVKRWYKNLETTAPGFEEVKKGSEIFNGFFKSVIEGKKN